jgi:hypothetical protein
MDKNEVKKGDRFVRLEEDNDLVCGEIYVAYSKINGKIWIMQHEATGTVIEHVAYIPCLTALWCKLPDRAASSIDAQIRSALVSLRVAGLLLLAQQVRSYDGEYFCSCCDVVSPYGKGHSPNCEVPVFEEALNSEVLKELL